MNCNLEDSSIISHLNGFKLDDVEDALHMGNLTRFSSQQCLDKSNLS